jgi:hypothetical protein
MMTDSKNTADKFVADGYWRARTASEPYVRAEVLKEFDKRLQEAPLEELPSVQREMEQEVQRRLDQIAPPWALY